MVGTILFFRDISSSTHENRYWIGAIDTISGADELRATRMFHVP